MPDEPTFPLPSELPLCERFQGDGVELLRRSVSLLPIPAVVVDLETRRVLALNRLLADRLGLPLQALLGRTPEELGFRPDDDDRRLVLEGTANGQIHHVQRRTRLPDGSWAEYTDSSRRLLVDGRECLLSCFEPASKVVASAASERRASEEKFRIVAEMSLDMLSRHDLDGICSWASSASRQILRIEPAALVGRDAFDFVHPDDRGAVRAALDELLRVGRSRLQYRTVRPDGSVLWVESLWSLARSDSGEPREIHCSTRDVSERRESDLRIRDLNETLERRVEERTFELQSALRELESFSYSISHDLRSPLRAIDGFSSALVEDAFDQLTPESRHHLERIRAAARRMGRLIDDLLRLSRSSRVEIVRTEIEVSVLASQVLDDLVRQSDPRPVRLRIEPGIVAQGDEVLVRSVLENLLGNAWKYSSLKPESVIELTSEVEENRRWILIRDNGIGFDMDHADKLFGTFQRLHPADQFEGTGIGLATVRRIVERHGGAVSGSAVPGVGAVFRFTLDPAREARP